MSALGLLNFLVLQWFGIRLAKVVRKEFVTMHIGLDVPLYRDVFVRWTVLRWIMPLTGWWSNYRYISFREPTGRQP